MQSESIAAIATALSPAGIGIIRISGGDSFKIAETVFKNKKGEKIKVTEKETKARLKEMADMYICLECLKHAYDVEEFEIQKAIDDKLDKVYETYE